MSARIIPFPKFYVRAEPADEGGWLVLCRSHGWLHGDRDAAVKDARWIAGGYGVHVSIRDHLAIAQSRETAS